jgi:antitoxin VapB
VSLNIKNEETHRLVRRLAALTGQSQTSAVADAVRRRLEELERAESHSARREAMMRIARESAALVDQDLNNDPNEVLYDEVGMPR